MTAARREAVKHQAAGRCQYCHLPDFAMDPEDFHVEHIFALKHGGKDGLENLHFLQPLQGPEPRQFRS